VKREEKGMGNRDERILERALGWGFNSPLYRCDIFGIPVLS
jgi:hypothetical protein